MCLQTEFVTAIDQMQDKEKNITNIDKATWQKRKNAPGRRSARTHLNAHNKQHLPVEVYMWADDCTFNEWFCWTSVYKIYIMLGEIAL